MKELATTDLIAGKLYWHRDVYNPCKYTKPAVVRVTQVGLDEWNQTKVMVKDIMAIDEADFQVSNMYSELSEVHPDWVKNMTAANEDALIRIARELQVLKNL